MKKKLSMLGLSFDPGDKTEEINDILLLKTANFQDS